MMFRIAKCYGCVVVASLFLFMVYIGSFYMLIIRSYPQLEYFIHLILAGAIYDLIWANPVPVYCLIISFLVITVIFSLVTLHGYVPAVFCLVISLIWLFLAYALHTVRTV